MDPGPRDLAALAHTGRDVWSAGHGVAAITDVPPVADLVDRLEAEYDAALARLVAPVAE